MVRWDNFMQVSLNRTPVGNDGGLFLSTSSKPHIHRLWV